MISQSMNNLGIYIHYPWCLQKCSYCDFFSIPVKSLTEEDIKSGNDLYTKTVLRELSLRKNMFPEKTVSSMYFGGGTATLLDAGAIHAILRETGRIYDTSICEITVEGNPESITPDYLASLHQAGVNRVNAGFQSFSEKSLAELNRFYRKESYDNALSALSHSPIKNWGGDLMYGLPAQTEEDFYNDLDILISHNPKHLSLYSLTVEENTALASSIRKKEIAEPDDRIQQKILLDLKNHLLLHDFIQYEVSNFARPGFECRHNLRYWMYGRYMGLGPGAHGFNGKIRYGNPRNIETWLKNPVAAKETKIIPEEEIPLMILRLTIPISVNYILSLADRFIPEFFSERGENRIRSLIESWKNAGYIRMNPNENSEIFSNAGGDYFSWTAAGLQFLDERILEFSECLELK